MSICLNTCSKHWSPFHNDYIFPSLNWSHDHISPSHCLLRLLHHHPCPWPPLEVLFVMLFSCHRFHSAQTYVDFDLKTKSLAFQASFSVAFILRGPARSQTGLPAQPMQRRCIYVTNLWHITTFPSQGTVSPRVHNSTLGITQSSCCSEGLTHLVAGRQ